MRNRDDDNEWGYGRGTRLWAYYIDRRASDRTVGTMSRWQRMRVRGDRLLGVQRSRIPVKNWGVCVCGRWREAKAVEFVCSFACPVRTSYIKGDWRRLSRRAM